MKTILLTGAYRYSASQLQEIKDLGFKIVFIKDEREELLIDVSDIEVVVCNNLFVYHDIKKFSSLKVIQLTSAGMDRVPLQYIKEKNIRIYNAGDTYSIPMAEWAILKILEIYKKSKIFYNNQEQHIWEKERNIFELTDKRVAIIGYGSVGKEIAKRLRGFGVRIITVSRKYNNCDNVDESYLMEDIQNVLSTSDIVILSLPLDKITKHLINKVTIGYMKEDAILINIARGAIVEESALIESLDCGKFMGVALDVFEEEPLQKSKLWDYERVLITPHNSFISDKIEERLFLLILENLKGVIK